MTIINIVFIALFVCAAVGLIAYRQGLGTGARVQRQNDLALKWQQTKIIESLTARVAALVTRQDKIIERAIQCEARADALATKQETHQAQLEAIMQDADTRIAIYASRANPFNQQDRITLQAAANQLAAAANTYAGLQANDHLRFAHQMQQRLLNLVERLDITLNASAQQTLQQGEQPADKAVA